MSLKEMQLMREKEGVALGNSSWSQKIPKDARFLPSVQAGQCPREKSLKSRGIEMSTELRSVSVYSPSFI